MATITNVAGAKPTGARAGAVGGVRFDWLYVLFGLWFLIGLFIDGWAHNHDRVDDTFFTPWHAIFYAGFVAQAGLLVVAAFINRSRGLRGLRAIPAGYELALVGVALFATGGVADMLWHIRFGIEVAVDALLSPSHLLLALGGLFLATGTLRAAWRRKGAGASQNWAAWIPVLLSLVSTFSLLTFMSQYAHPYVNGLSTWADMRRFSSNDEFFRQALGVSSILLQSGLLIGLVLIALRRWTLPFGTLTLLFTLNAVLMGALRDHLMVTPAAVVGGLAADVLNWRLRPSLARPGALRLFAFATPAVLYALYFLALHLAEGLAWSVTLWLGAILLAGVVGLLISYVMLPPAVPGD
jgi:hypothetical protein